jgi:hypothetical protein
MNVTSDPFIHRVADAPSRPSLDGRDRAPVRTRRGVPQERPIVARVMAKSLVLGAAALLALRIMGGWLAEPLAPIAGVAATWNVEVTSSASSSMLAFAYSEESGLHLLRIPGDGSAEPRVIPARLARGELHLVSLGLGQLQVHAKGPPGSGVLSFDARSRTVTAFEHPKSTGVRTGW